MRAVNQPVSWWGWHYQPPLPMSVLEIVRAGSMPTGLAAAFWVAMERGASLIVAADPPSAGKTATLSALLSFTPPDTVVYFSRGVGETFDLPPPSHSHPTYLLVNEMSDHLPVYTWDDDARRAFALLAQGYSLGTTMHADSVAEVLGQLEGELHIPKREIANLTFVVTLHVGHARSIQRRVKEVALLQPDGAGLAVRTLAEWDPGSDTFSVLASSAEQEALARWAGLSQGELAAELVQREAFLQELLAEGRISIAEVNAALEGWYGERVQRKG